MSDSGNSLVPKIKTLITKYINFTPLDVHWLPYSTKLVTIGESFDSKGVLHVYNLIRGRLNLECEYIQDYPSKCCSFGISSFASRDLALGDFEGNLSVIDLERGVSNFKIQKAHKGRIQTIDGLGIKNNMGPPEVATGGKDGIVKIWDLRTDKPSIILEPKDIQKNYPECWTVSYGDIEMGKKIGIGYDNGDIKIFDLRMDKIFFGENLKNGICSIEFDKKNIPLNRMIVTTLGSKFYLYDLNNLNNLNYTNNNYNSIENKDAKNPVYKKLYVENKTQLWGAKFLPQEKNMFVSLGGNGSLNLYKFEKSDFIDNNKEKLKIINSCRLSSLPIIGFDWHFIKTDLACLVSLDNSIRICNI